jgi:DHA3 family macrolide efflux protein-like MFS transporter
MALVSTIFTPSLEAVIPSIVESGQLTGANALINSTAMVGLLVGPALSGIGIATIGLEKVLYVSAVTFVLSVAALGKLKIKGDGHARATAQSDGFVQAFKKGLHFVLVQRRTVAAFVLTALCYSLAASAFVFLLPVYAEKTLHVGAMILGWLWSSYGAGMVVVSASLAFLRQCAPSTRLLIIIVAMMVGGIASFLLASTTFPLAAMVLVALVGAGLASFSPIVWGLLQKMTPDALRGRVFGIFNTGAMAASMIGMVAFGWTTDRLGAKVSLIGMTAIFGITAVSLILLRQFGDLRPSHAVAKKSRRPQSTNRS